MTGYPLLTDWAKGVPFEETTITLTNDRPTYHGQTDFVIRPGVITADAVELFGYAHCKALAGAITERTGWPIAWFKRCKGGTWEFTHAGVLTPSGLVLDIHGLRTPELVVDELRVETGFDVRWQRLEALPPDAVRQRDFSSGLVVQVIRYFAEQLCKEAN